MGVKLLILIFGFSLLFSLEAFGVLRDPTRPIGVEEITKNTGKYGSFNIRMIVVKNGNSFVDVDGVIVKVGEQINGATVVAIKENGIVLRGADNIIFQSSFYHGIVKKNFSKQNTSTKEGVDNEVDR
jgi:hypothetical protein